MATDSDQENSKNWFLYMIETRQNSIYTGITTSIERRFREHTAQGKKCAKYLRGKMPLKLIFQIIVGTKSEALSLERKIKKLTASEKREIIQNSQKS